MVGGEKRDPECLVLNQKLLQGSVFSHALVVIHDRPRLNDAFHDILFSKVAGAAEGLLRNIPSKRILFGAAKMGSLMSSEEERKGPAEAALQAYTGHMKDILGQAELLG